MIFGWTCFSLKKEDYIEIRAEREEKEKNEDQIYRLDSEVVQQVTNGHDYKLSRMDHEGCNLQECDSDDHR